MDSRRFVEVDRLKIRNQSCVYTLSVLIEMAFYMHTKRAFSKQYNSITTAELIAGTSGVPFSRTSQFFLLCLLPVGGLSCSSNISSSQGNG